VGLPGGVTDSIWPPPATSKNVLSRLTFRIAILEADRDSFLSSAGGAGRVGLPGGVTDSVWLPSPTSENVVSNKDQLMFHIAICEAYRGR
jgi:hypothetical protein